MSKPSDPEEVRSSHGTLWKHFRKATYINLSHKATYGVSDSLQRHSTSAHPLKGLPYFFMPLLALTQLYVFRGTFRRYYFYI